MPQEILEIAARTRFCRFEPCILIFVDDRRAMLIGRTGKDVPSQTLPISRRQTGQWSENDDWTPATSTPPATVNVVTGTAEVRTVPRKQVFVDGVPVGQVFE